jgi:NADPH-dependent 2,4-dienoyl-CoA reductase/sulfur reductase-like enzyme
MGSLGTQGSSDPGYLVCGDPEEFHPRYWAPGKLAKRQPETHLNVLVIGAGLCGLMTALECWRKGHNIVGILDRSEGPIYAGMLLPT